MTAYSRILDLEGIHNFRDYGGYAMTQGGRLRQGWLFRSAQHRDATATDLLTVGRLGLAGVIDLRGGSERAAAPCPRPEGFSAELLFVEEDTAGLAPHIAAAENVMDAADARKAMVAGYRTMPFRPKLMAILSRYFEALGRIDGPTLVHCMAGKDRTGFAVALLHSLAGVAWDDIVADYLFTNVAGRVDDRIAAGAADVRRAFGATIGDEAVRALMMCDGTYLDAAFEAIRERHGSIDAYLADVLRVTPARREAIVERIAA